MKWEVGQVRLAGDGDVTSLCKALGFCNELGCTEGRILSRDMLPTAVDEGKGPSAWDFS